VPGDVSCFFCCSVSFLLSCSQIFVRHESVKKAALFWHHGLAALHKFRCSKGRLLVLSFFSGCSSRLLLSVGQHSPAIFVFLVKVFGHRFVSRRALLVFFFFLFDPDVVTSSFFSRTGFLSSGEAFCSPVSRFFSVAVSNQSRCLSVCQRQPPYFSSIGPVFALSRWLVGVFSFPRSL